MGTISTPRGDVEEKLLDKHEYPVDDSAHWGNVVEYRFKDDGALAAKFLSGFVKDNPFVPVPNGLVLIEVEGRRAEVDASSLDRIVGQTDNENEFTCWVEYRLKGTDTVVHRTASVVLKRAASEGRSEAGGIG